MGNSGVLSGSAIKTAIKKGQIVVDPFREERVNPYSYDLTLGRKVAVYRAVTSGSFAKTWANEPRGQSLKPNPSGMLDASAKNEVLEYELEEKEPFLLHPGIGYLMHTEERVWTDSFVPVLDGKSSIGRLFAAVHVTAGYGEANFNGQWTLEVIVTHPLLVYPGMRCCQMRFHTISGAKDQYSGNYTGNDAVGPIPSKAWKQIEDDGLLKGK